MKWSIASESKYQYQYQYTMQAFSFLAIPAIWPILWQCLQFGLLGSSRPPDLVLVTPCLLCLYGCTYLPMTELPVAILHCHQHGLVIFSLNIDQLGGESYSTPQISQIQPGVVGSLVVEMILLM